MQKVGRSKSNSAQLRGAQWLVMMAGIAGSMPACKPAEYVTPDVCLHQIRVRELFAQTAEAAASLGRFDPYAYAIGPDDKLLPAVGEGSDAVARLREALSQINGDSAARQVFRHNLDAAKQLCPEANCPQGTFPVSITRTARISDQRKVFDFKFTGERPPENVLKAFGALYTYSSPDAKECNSPPALDLAKFRIYSESGNCLSSWHPPESGQRCRPPKNGHWREDGEDLCCE